MGGEVSRDIQEDRSGLNTTSLGNRYKASQLLSPVENGVSRTCHADISRLFLLDLLLR